MKSHGLGNDFILVERSLSPAVARAMCAPRRGIGADGVICIDMPGESSRVDGESDRAGARAAETASMDAHIVIRNADGSRPEMCGNGLRCVVRYLEESRGLDGDGHLVVETDAGRRRGRVTARGDSAWQVEVSMGEANLGDEVDVTGPDGGESVSLTTVDVGNPHAVVFDRAWDVDAVAELGGRLNDGHDAFPDGVNLEVVRPTATDRIVATVYERGVGLTDACGSGACAIAVAGWDRGMADDDNKPVEVELPGGVLTVERRDDRLWLTGPTVRVFEGQLNVDALDTEAVEASA